MKTKYVLAISLVAILFLAGCKKDDPTPEPDPENQPTKAEKDMIPTEMTWALDSTLYIYNYQQTDESSEMIHKGEGLADVVYTFYPYTYRFPSDLYFVGEMGGDTIYLAKEYDEDYCKYICKYHGDIIAAGKLWYYKDDYFTFSGYKAGGWVEFMMREADTNWNVDVWTSAYNDTETDDGIVLERHVEYYSRVR